MNNECDVFGDAEVLPRGMEILAMLLESIPVRAAVRQFVAVAHADQIDGDAAALIRHMRHDVAPEVGGGRIAMLKDDGFA